jgi:pimeloyl-ACP methyl ester carboxylesterase
LSGRLAPAVWSPAGVDGITVRRVTLASGHTLRVLEAGPGDGPPVLLVHGWAVSAYLWRHNILPLASAGYRVIAPDMLGHGLSDAPGEEGTYALGPFAQSVLDLLDALGIASAAVAGQSMGGKLVVQAARMAPARITRITLFGPVGFGLVPTHQGLSPFVPTPPGELLSFMVPRRLVEFVQHRVYGKLGWFSERDVDEYWAPTQFPEVVRAQFQMLKEFSWGLWDESTLRSVVTPIHVVFGTRDRTVRPKAAERLAAALPNGRLTWILDGGHVVMEEAPERVNALLLEDLRG